MKQNIKITIIQKISIKHELQTSQTQEPYQGELKKVEQNLGTYKIEGWLEYHGKGWIGKEQQYEIKIKPEVKDQLFLFSNNYELGRFIYREEKNLYSLISSKIIQVNTQKVKFQLIINQNLTIINIPFQFTLLQDLWDEKSIDQLNLSKKRLSLLKLQNTMSEIYFYDKINQKGNLVTLNYHIRKQGLLSQLIKYETQKMSNNDEDNYCRIKLNQVKIRGGLIHENTITTSCFQIFSELISQRRNKNLIITYNSSLAKQILFEIRIRFPQLKAKVYDPSENTPFKFDDLNILIISFSGVRDQYKISSQLTLETIFSAKWKRIILDLTAHQQNYHFPQEVDKLVSKYKWCCVQNSIIQEFKTLEQICYFFDLNLFFIQANFQKNDEITNFLNHITFPQTTSIQQYQVEINNSLFNLDDLEMSQYKQQFYLYKENFDQQNNRKQQFLFLRQLCCQNTIDISEKNCEICFSPLQIYFEIQSCKHTFCFYCLQQFSECQLCYEPYTQNEIKIVFSDPLDYFPLRISRLNHLHQIIKQIPKDEKIVILTQMPGCSQEISHFLTQKEYLIYDTMQSKKVDEIIEIIYKFNNNYKQNILIINPFLIYRWLLVIRQANHVIFFEPLQNMKMEETLWTRLYNIKSITKIIAKQTIEEQIIWLQDLWSNDKTIEGYEENSKILKELLNF